MEEGGEEGRVVSEGKNVVLGRFDILVDPAYSSLSNQTSTYRGWSNFAYIYVPLLFTYSFIFHCTCSVVAGSCIYV